VTNYTIPSLSKDAMIETKQQSNTFLSALAVASQTQIEKEKPLSLQ